VEASQLEAARLQGERRGREAAAVVLDQLARELEEREERLKATLARTASELALEIARTLLRSEISEGRYDLERIVRDTLRDSGVGRGHCVVHLNPADHAQLAAARFRSGTRLEPDEGIARGNVHVETQLGLLVRDMDGALDSIARRLREELP